MTKNTLYTSESLADARINKREGIQRFVILPKNEHATMTMSFARCMQQDEEHLDEVTPLPAPLRGIHK